MTLPLGALAALGSSFTWAYASTRYAVASREAGSLRVNLARSLVVLPIYVVVALVLHGGHAADGVARGSLGWLVASVLCSYGLADGLFFAAARRIGVSTALSIASSYPLWAALVGTLRGEPFGVVRAGGTLLCVFGVIALVALSRRDAEATDRTSRGDLLGLLLAFATSFLWAGNSVSVKHGSVGLDVWQVNAIRYAIALPVLGVQLAATRVLRGPTHTRPLLPALIPAILVDALLGSILFVYGLGHTDLAVGASLSSLAPLLSVPIAIALGEERWSPPRLGAITATVAGIVLLLL